MKRKGIFIISIIVLALVFMLISKKNEKYEVYVEDKKYGYDNYDEYELKVQELITNNKEFRAEINNDIIFNLKNRLKEYELSEKQIDELTEQYVQGNECPYEQFLPSIWVASCEIFGTEIDTDTNIGYVYAYVLDEEYVKFKDLAYEQSGGHLPVKMKVRIDGEDIQLLESEIPMDGSEYKESMKELFPRKYYLAAVKYNPFDQDGKVKLGKKNAEKINDMWGVEVSDKFMLQISEDGSYEIIWTTGDGADEEFEVHVKEKGQLKALN